MERLRESSQLRPLVINVGSDTFGNPIFSEGLTKLAKILDFKRTGMLCLALPARRIVPRLDFQSEFSMSKSFDFFPLRNKILEAHFLLK